MPVEDEAFDQKRFEITDMSKGPAGANLTMVKDRAMRLLEFIFAQAEDEIALVSHGGFLHNGLLQLLDMSDADRDKVAILPFHNCDLLTIHISTREAEDGSQSWHATLLPPPKQGKGAQRSRL